MLQQALASLFAQTWPALEVILVDNGSIDGSAEQAERCFGDRLRVIRNREERGIRARQQRRLRSRARASGCSCSIPTRCVRRKSSSELMAFVAGKPDVGQLACRVVQADQPHFYDSAGLLLYPDGIARPRGWQEKDQGQYDRAEEVLAPHGCACALRKAMLDQIGGFDEDFFCYFEDLDLGVRGQLAGWKCWYVPTSAVRHKKSATAGNYSVFKAYHVERNRLYCLWKWMPRFLVFVSPLFTLNRYAMQGYAAHTHQGLSADFVKEYSLARLFVRADSRMVGRAVAPAAHAAQAAAISASRKIAVREWYDLISRFKLDAIELALKF